MTKIHAELLINARSRRSRTAQPDILLALKDAGVMLDYHNVITADVSFNEALDSIKKRNPRLLIVCGGDGTISDTVDHLVGSDIEIGLIPLGTTNNYARSLNIPIDITGAVKTIINSKATLVDLGRIKQDYFANVAGIGLSAETARHVTDSAKRRWGRLAYAVVGLSQLIKHRPFHVTVSDKDNELTVHYETHQLIVANGRYHAGRQIAEDAQVDNGQLVIFALGNASKLNLLWHTIDFYIGKRKKISHASYLIGNDIKITTTRPQPIELDGEVKFTTPVAVRVAKKVIKVRFPAPI